MSTALRQFEVVHIATGTVTRVVAKYVGGQVGEYIAASAKAGYRYPADCTVRLVPREKEVPLPFDEIPVVLRRRR